MNRMKFSGTFLNRGKEIRKSLNWHSHGHVQQLITEIFLIAFVKRKSGETKVINKESGVDIGYKREPYYTWQRRKKDKEIERKKKKKKKKWIEIKKKERISE